MTDGVCSPAPESADPALHDLYRRWADLSGRGRLPSAKDLGLDDLLEVQPGAVLITVEPRAEGSRRYVYSRVGTGHYAVLGRDIQGYSIDELAAPQQVDYFEAVYDKVVDEARPHYWMRVNAQIGTKLHTFERLIVPVSEDGDTVDGFVGVWIWL
ncbi:PAS domain-containing protein [Microbaculum marinisediminis]|uniref:PAS domain-containing protein n=1 Tax=Microbaculum marinisediminis TaxID=2931392 RepID=A0AAW5QSU1_9HYPH|nr:PAS domain-containing protein [Microbaculum sp. A6E488]MCT8971111.1 PAS domain-containing protein [Microbaculum sp. A6E488]